MKTKRILFAFLPGLLTILVAITTASFIGPDSVDEIKLRYNVGKDHVAVQGYSLVAYHRDLKAIKGNPEYSYEHDDITYHFSNLEELALFADSPESYLPKYGGYCSYGVSINKRLDIDPNNFKVVNGELHLFFQEDGYSALEEWEKHNEKKMIEKADARWEVLSRVW